MGSWIRKRDTVHVYFVSEGNEGGTQSEEGSGMPSSALKMVGPIKPKARVVCGAEEMGKVSRLGNGKGWRGKGMIQLTSVCRARPKGGSRFGWELGGGREGGRLLADVGQR